MAMGFFMRQCALSGRVVDVDELVRQPELGRHMCRHRGRAIALAGVVAAGQIGHAALARVVRLRLGYFAGDEGIGAGGNGRFKIALRAAAAPALSF